MEHKRETYERLVALAVTLPPLPTAVAHPCDHDSLSSVIEAARPGLIAPILVAPRVKLEAAARQGADSVITRLASCAVASMVALARHENLSAAIV